MFNLSILNLIFPMTDYVIPEGMKLYREYCSLTFWKLFYGELPSWECSPQFVPIDYFDTVVESTINISFETLGLSILFVFAVGILGATVVELLYNKLDWFITPLCNLINRRYRTVVEIRRLNSMNGHP